MSSSSRPLVPEEEKRAEVRNVAPESLPGPKHTAAPSVELETARFPKCDRESCSFNGHRNQSEEMFEKLEFYNLF